MRPKHYLVTLVAFLAGGLAVVAQTNSTASDAPANTGAAAAGDVAASAAKDPAAQTAVTNAAAAGTTQAAQTAPTDAAPAADAAAGASATAAGAAPASAVAEPAPAAKDATVAEAPAVPSAAAAAAEAPVAAAEAPAANPTAQVAATANAAAANAAPADAPAAAPAGASTPPAAATIPLIVMDDVPLMDAIRNLARQAGINYMVDPKVTFGTGDGKTPPPSVSIRWENVTAEQALNALLGNYSLQMVEDPKSKISHVTVKDPAAPEPLITKVVQLKYTSPTNLIAAIQNTLIDKRSKVMPDIRTSQLVVLATETEMAGVEQLVERLDMETKQVLIEARLMETIMNPTSSKGIDWANTVANQHVTFGNGNTTGTAGSTTSKQSGNNVGSDSQPFVAPQTALNGAGSTAGQVLTTLLGGGGLGLNTAHGFYPATAFLNADGVSAAISFLNTYAETKVISAPRTVTLDNEPAHIEVGQQWPVLSVSASTANQAGGSSVSYSNLTVRLDVTPRISANNYVNLKVSPRIVRHTDDLTVLANSQTYTAPIFDIRDIEASVMIPSGNTLVMGGMIEDEIDKSNSKVPLLGDIPGLGYLFRRDTKNRKKTNLIVFLTPTIVQDADFQPTKTEFMKTPVPANDSLGEDWSAWDSGEPKDWKKDKKDKDKQARKDDDKFSPLTADASAQ